MKRTRSCARSQPPKSQRWLDDPHRTTYLLDVRTPEEFDAGSLPGAVHAPGGQLVQATDQWVACATRASC